MPTLKVNLTKINKTFQLILLNKSDVIFQVKSCLFGLIKNHLSVIRHVLFSQA